MSSPPLRPVYDEHETQTDERMLKVRLRLDNLSAYVDTHGDNVLAVARVGRLWVQDRHTAAASDDSEILVRMRKIAADAECAPGLVDLRFVRPR